MSNILNFDTKTETYYSYNRQEMLKFIPKNSKTILEFGCGKGYFGKLVKSTYSVEYWGVEIDSNSANIATKHIDKIFRGAIEELIDNLPKNNFDCIVFNDVLEHLVDPYTILNKCKFLLVAGGVIVSSIPNVRYFGNLYELIIRKDWKYKDEGILDKTHLRFFTKKSLENTFQQLNFDIIDMEGLSPIKDFRFEILNILTMGYLADTRFSQFASVIKPKD